LKAATINGARALGVDGRLGSIEAGKLADLYVVRGNPLEDIKAARDIKIVFRDGIAYDPAELLQSAEGKIGPAGPNDHADWELEIRPLQRETHNQNGRFRTNTEAALAETRLQTAHLDQSRTQ